MSSNPEIRPDYLRNVCMATFDWRLIGCHRIMFKDQAERADVASGGCFFLGGPVVPSSGSLVNLVAGGETRFSFRVDCYAPHGSPWTCKIRATVDTERFDILLIGPTEKFIFWSIESEKERDIEVVLLSMLWLTIAGTAYPRACTLAASSPISFKYQWHGAMNYLL